MTELSDSDDCELSQNGEQCGKEAVGTLVDDSQLLGRVRVCNDHRKLLTGKDHFDFEQS
jgi:hypothetical protein